MCNFLLRSVDIIFDGKFLYLPNTVHETKQEENDEEGKQIYDHNDDRKKNNGSF